MLLKTISSNFAILASLREFIFMDDILIVYCACVTFVSTPVPPDKIHEPTGPVMLLRITHMAVAGQQVLDDNAVIAAIDAVSACYFIGKLKGFGNIFQT